MNEYSAKLVDSALETGKLYEGEGFKYIKESFPTNTLHLIGLLSDGGVHSRLDQLLVSFLGSGPFLPLSGFGFSTFSFPILLSYILFVSLSLGVVVG